MKRILVALAACAVSVVLVLAQGTSGDGGGGTTPIPTPLTNAVGDAKYLRKDIIDSTAKGFTVTAAGVVTNNGALVVSNATVRGTLGVTGPATFGTIIVDVVTNRTSEIISTNLTIQGSLIVANTGVLTNLGSSSVSNLVVWGTLNVDGTTTLTNCADGATVKSLATIGQLNATNALKLSLTGGTMGGIIDMGGQLVTNMANGVGLLDSVNVTQLNATNALCLRLTGGTMSGPINDGGNVITNSAVMAATWHYLTGNTNAVYGNARIGLDSNFSSGSNVVIQIYTTGGVWTNAQRFQEP